MEARRVLSCFVLACIVADTGCEGAPPPPPPTHGRRDAGPCELIVEVCNGVDDDCNGVVDDTGEVELCDGLDQDCDGLVDEGADCQSYTLPGTGGWMLGAGSSGVIVTDDGALTLDPPRVDIVQPALWIANSGEGTVSRLDPMTGRETGRYPSILPDSGLVAGSLNAPSRTALDQRLDAYVANRAFGHQASVSKIAGELSRCVDRDLDGMIETSMDLDDDGVIDSDPTAGELLPDDECVLWNVLVGGENAVARALAIGLAGPDGEVGDVWVGLFNEERVVVLSQLDGHEIASVPIGLSPYGAVAGPGGRIWLTSGPAGYRSIVAVDPFTYEVEQVPLPGSSQLRTYGISVDGLGRVILAATEARWRGVIAYDTSDGSWSRSISIPDPTVGLGPVAMLRGISASADRIWVAGPNGTEGALYELAVADLSLVGTHDLAGASDVVGVGVAFDGRIWGIAQDVSMAYRLDRTTGTIDHFPTGMGPYTYSDFTGFGLNGILGAAGVHRVTVEGCNEAVWTSLSVDADVPADTRLAVRVRSAETLAALESASWIGPFDTSAGAVSLTSAPGPVPAGRYLEISLWLWSSTPGVVPRVFSLAAAARCDDLG
ncbi:MAG: hypothetical protein K1X94_12505 [Sandaracinaceae bacterium]|nr:hypothetical protein [Sandaracinaceae bacterium]